MVGTGKALDPAKYYIVTFALFSNGEVCIRYSDKSVKLIHNVIQS